MYKCAGEGGQPIYQDSPCPPGKELRNFDQDPVEIAVMPLRPGSGTPTHAPAGQAGKAPSLAPPSATRGKVAERRRDAAERRFIRPGMTEAEVTAKIGPPDMTGRRQGPQDARAGATCPRPATRRRSRRSCFDNGKVIEVERKVVP